jgi:hypothetical protein
MCSTRRSLCTAPTAPHTAWRQSSCPVPLSTRNTLKPAGQARACHSCPCAGTSAGHNGRIGPIIYNYRRPTANLKGGGGLPCPRCNLRQDAQSRGLSAQGRKGPAGLRVEDGKNAGHPSAEDRRMGAHPWRTSSGGRMGRPPSSADAPSTPRTSKRRGAPVRCCSLSAACRCRRRQARRRWPTVVARTSV